MSCDRDAAIDVFFSYSHRDEDLRDELERHFAVLKRDGLVRTWHDRRIGAGREWEGEIDEHLEAADLVLLLVSADFLHSDYCFDVEMRRALERHDAGRARVVPVVLRPVDWGTERLARLQALPTDGRPLTRWDDRDAACVDVVQGIRAVIAELLQRRPDSSSQEQEPSYPDDATRELSQALEDAYRREEELLSHGQDTTHVQGEILDLRRRIREGGQLKAGDFLLGGRFRLLEPIGRGGFATVWKATDRKGRGLVAIKVLHGQYAQDRTRRERFFRGARKMAELHHQGIVRVIEEECEDGGFLFFVMEYVGGGDFGQAVLENRLTLEQRLQVILEVGAALSLAHQRGVIHRDVKPGNILLDEQNQPKLTDFDLVRAVDTTGGTRTQGMLGTFLYAAPEVLVNPKEASKAADVFALGMSTVFALAGEDLRLDVLRDTESFIAGLPCPNELKPVLARAVAWDPGQRPGSLEAFCQELRESATGLLPAVTTHPSGEILQARLASPEPKASPLLTVRRRRFQALLAVVLLFVLGYWAWNQISSEDPDPSDTGTADLNASGEGTGHPSEIRSGPPPALPASCEGARQKTGIEFVPVPEGWYTLGTDEDLEAYREQDRHWPKPEHRVWLSAFWIGKTEVTNGHYQRFLEANPEHPKPSHWDDERFNQPDQPVVGVSWLDALGFSRWAGSDLPTEAEWEAAARGPEALRYPWGDAEPTSELANFGDEMDRPNSVGSYINGAGPFGTLDQAGNVWEWCLDQFDSTAYQGRDGQRNPKLLGDETDESAVRVLRGGSWAYPARTLPAAFRDWHVAGFRSGDFGFRVVCRSGPEHGD